MESGLSAMLVPQPLELAPSSPPLSSVLVVGARVEVVDPLARAADIAVAAKIYLSLPSRIAVAGMTAATMLGVAIVLIGTSFSTVNPLACHAMSSAVASLSSDELCPI